MLKQERNYHNMQNYNHTRHAYLTLYYNHTRLALTSRCTVSIQI